MAQKVAQKESNKTDDSPSHNINYYEFGERLANEPKFIKKVSDYIEIDIQNMIDRSIEAAKRGEY